jgi:hypothetical protein
MSSILASAVAWFVGVGLGVGLLIILYCMSLPAQPFVYVGF